MSRTAYRFTNPRSPMSDASFVQGVLEDKDMGLFGWVMWRGIPWCWRHKRAVGLAFLWFLMVRRSGLISGTVGWAIMVLVLGAIWVTWKRRVPEGDSQSVRDLLEGERLKAKLLDEWASVCDRARLVGRGKWKGIPKLRDVTVAGHGTLTATCLAGPAGVTVSEMRKAADSLREFIGCREVVVDEAGSGVARLTFHWRDVLGRIWHLADIPIAAAGRIAYGVRQDGSVASISMGLSVLIGGLTGKGKSTIVWGMLSDLIRQGVWIDLYVSDTKGTEFAIFEEMVSKDRRYGNIRVREYANTVAETEAMIGRAAKAMQCRKDEMRAAGKRMVEPSAENPLVIVLIDEMLPLAKMLAKGHDSPLAIIASQGRALSYVIWGLCQVGQLDVLGRIRDLIPQRICFATPNDPTTDAILGQHASSNGAKCSDLDEPGLGYSYSEGDKTPRVFKSARVTDAETLRLAVGELPKDVADKAREMYDLAAEKTKRQTALYRWYHADAPQGSRPAYIGISYDVLQREADHNAALKEFMAGDVKRTVDYYPTRKAALAAEKTAIETEKPTYNVQHNGRNPFRKVDQRQKREKVDA